MAVSELNLETEPAEVAQTSSMLIGETTINQHLNGPRTADRVKRIISLEDQPSVGLELDKYLGHADDPDCHFWEGLCSQLIERRDMKGNSLRDAIVNANSIKKLEFPKT